MKTRSTSILVVLPLLAYAASCGEEESEGPAAHVATPLTEGRSFAVVPAGAQELASIVIGDAESEATLDDIRTRLVADCDARISARFSGVLDDPTLGGVCRPSTDAPDQQRQLCLGHRWRMLADAVASVDVFDDGTVEMRAPLEPGETQAERRDALALRGLRYTFPVPDNSSAATFALLATDAFREAALIGGDLVDPVLCPDGHLSQTVPGGSDDGADGTSPLPADEVSLGFVVTAALGESLLQMHESAAVAQRRVQAAAQAQLSEERDQRRAVGRSWVGVRDSRIEALAIWTGMPDPSSVPPGGPPPGTPGCTSPVNCYPVDPCSPLDNPDDEPAVLILQATRVDPRLNDASMPIPRTVDDLVADVKDAVIEDYTAVFGDTAATPPDEWIRTYLDTTPEALVRAAKYLTQRARVLGRTIRPSTTDPRASTRSGTVRHVTRVVGTAAGGPSADPAFLFARTTGQARFDDTEGLAREHVLRGGSSRTSPADRHFPPESYARRGVLNAIDHVASALSRSLRRTDLGATPTAVVDPVVGTPLYNVAVARQFVRQNVPMRMQIATGRVTSTSVDRVRLRLYGTDGDHTSFDVWVGEEGLACALRGSVEGEPCDSTAYRLRAEPRTITDSTGESGLGTRVIEWDVRPYHLPSGGSAIPEGTRLYVTTGDAGSRASITGLSVLGGPTAGTFSRISYVPVGSEPLAASTAPIDPSTDRCEEPRLCCGDLPCDLRIPLETELDEDSDDYETSFRHYLNAAREAAYEADALGQQLVEAGLNMDLRAEAARDELEALCGGVVNVESIAPRACNVDADCCPTCTGACIDGVCQVADPTLLEGSPDTSSVERCLGSGGDELQAVSLGDRALCYYEALDGETPPCDCGGTDCPACPVVRAGVSCEAMFPSLSAMQFRFEETKPIFISVADYDSFEPPDCTELIDIREGSEVSVDDLLAQGWLRQATFAALGETIGTSPGLYHSLAVTRGGATWLRTATEADGPVQGMDFPCGPHPMIDPAGSDCIGVSDTGRSLLCGISNSPGGCEDLDDRIEMNARLLQAVRIIAALGGASGRYIQQPGYRGATHRSSYDPYIEDVYDPFDRKDLMDADIGCTEAGISGDWDANGTLRWIRTGPQYLELFFPRYCYEDGSSCDDETACLQGFELDTSTQYLPISPLPGWFTDTHPGVTGSILSFFDSAASGLADPHARCVLLDSGTNDDAMHMELGAARCPTYFTRVPASFEDLGVGRTDPLRLQAFWSAFESFDINGENVPTLRNFLDNVAESADTNTEHEYSAAAFTLDEVPHHPSVEGYVPTGRMLDALELACVASYESGGGCPASLAELPEISSPNDFKALERILECAAAGIEDSLERMALFDLPETVADDLASDDVTGTYPAYRGQYGATVAELRASLEGVHMATQQIASVLRGFGASLSLAMNQAQIEDIESYLAFNQAVAQTASQVTRCATAVVDAIAIDPRKSASASLECADAVIQIELAWFSQQAQEDINDLQKQQIYLQLAQTFGQNMDALASAASQLDSTFASLNGLLAQLDLQRNAASSALAKVLFLDVDEVTGREFNVNRVMRSRYSTLAERYARAREKAIRLAWIARLAVEQKIGFDMSDMEDDLTLVAAPATWADRLCTMPAIDYEEIRAVGIEASPNPSYADAFIGDYVDDLESVLQSYPFDYPFSDGDDIAVISLRDEIYHSTVSCDVLGNNLLYYSADPSTLVPLGDGGWLPTCEDTGYCVTVTQTDSVPFLTQYTQADSGLLAPSLARALGGAVGQRMQMVDPAIPPVDPAAARPTHQQSLQLPAGTYLFSWYEKLADPPMGMDECGPLVEPAETLLEPFAAGEAHEVTVSVPASGPYFDPTAEQWLHSCWRRAWVVVENPSFQRVDIGWHVRGEPMGAPLPPVDFAAPHLENIPGEAPDLMSIEPTPFFPTDDDLSFLVDICEDSFGGVFRADNWQAVCAGPEPDDCYYEALLNVSLPEIEQGNIIESGAFATGNFNYRFIDFAVNLVGTGIRDCELTDRRSVCYASAFVPFSLRHDGPYRVRNHMGDVYDAPLQVGNVVRGKALTAERYVTNPVSSADEALLSSYWRTELRGRPLDGRYRLRIHHTPGFVWDRVRDVQLVLKYRYWTRFE